MTAGLVFGLCFAETGLVSAAGTPFVCSSNFYQVISGQLKLLDPSTGAYTDIGTAQADSYNAIGYNALDNYIYGIKTSVTDGIGALGNLVQISSDGTLTDLGAVSGLPLIAYFNGATDLAGNLYIRTGNATVYKINIASLTATPLSISGDAIGAANEAVFIANKLYLLIGSTLSIVDLSTNTSTNVTVTGPAGWLTASNNFGAGWTDQAGELFFSNNGTGSIYEITNLTSPTPTAVFKVAGAVTANNDGANCQSAQSPFAPPVATNDSYVTTRNVTLNVTITPLLSNDAGNALTVTAHTNPSHGTVVVNANGTFTYTPARNFTGSDSFTYTVSDSFGRTSTATVTIVVSASLLAPDTGFGASTTNHWVAISAVGGLGMTVFAIGIRKRYLAIRNN